MYFNSKIIVEFCGKHKLSINEFFILYLLYKKDYPLVYQYITQVEAFSTNQDRMKSLQARGFCVDKNTLAGGQYYPDQVVITQKFYNNLDKIFSLENAAEEVWEAFPGVLNLDGKNFPSKTISLEEFEPLYIKAIKNNSETHQKVLQALEKQKKEGSLMCGLKKWAECRQWELETTNGKLLSFSRDV